ncbi:MAG: nitroreductase family protein [Candidatus Krumholzibacteria bacterium]|nr:nitroreductase family protein [Candidatus Krumholzibacteria bacterium]
MSIDLILSRRSIRKFTDERVSDADITRLLEAGMAAPSSRNLKPWHFVTVTSREVLDSLAEAHPHGKMLFKATAAIAVCGQIDISPDYWVQDCSAATENILVAAAGLGLGSCWLGIHPRKDRIEAIGAILGIPGDTGILSLIAIGHPGEQKEMRTQYDESRVHREEW